MAHPRPIRLDDLLTKRPLSRRALTGGAAAGLALPAFLRGGGGAAAATELDFVIWSYGVEIVQDNITLFQERSPETTVTLSDFAWNVYRETMVNRFQAQTPTDVAYNGGDWLEEFATAGWVVPLEDHFDWVAGYQDKVLGFAWQDMTFDGKVYGLPYYADTITFMYDEQALADAGIEAPPTTWEEYDEVQTFFTERGNGDYYGGASQRAPSQVYHWWMVEFRTRGGRFFDPETMDATLDSEAGVETMQRMLASNASMPPGV